MTQNSSRFQYIVLASISCFHYRLCYLHLLAFCIPTKPRSPWNSEILIFEGPHRKFDFFRKQRPSKETRKASPCKEWLGRQWYCHSKLWKSVSPSGVPMLLNSGDPKVGCPVDSLIKVKGLHKLGEISVSTRDCMLTADLQARNNLYWEDNTSSRFCGISRVETTESENDRNHLMKMQECRGDGGFLPSYFRRNMDSGRFVGDTLHCSGICGCEDVVRWNDCGSGEFINSFVYDSLPTHRPFCWTYSFSRQSLRKLLDFYQLCARMGLWYVGRGPRRMKTLHCSQNP